MVGEQVLTLSASGWTYFTRFVLYDYETESLWFPLTGDPGFTCVSGVYADLKLEAFTLSSATWSEWLALHPDSKYLVTR
jgi:hypothetical protein